MRINQSLAGLWASGERKRQKTNQPSGVGSARLVWQGRRLLYTTLLLYCFQGRRFFSGRPAGVFFFPETLEDAGAISYMYAIAFDDRVRDLVG